MPILEEELSLVDHHLLIVEQQMSASHTGEVQQDEEDKAEAEDEEWSDEEEDMEIAEGR